MCGLPRTLFEPLHRSILRRFGYRLSKVIYLHEKYTNYRISSNNSRGRLFLFSHRKGAIIRGKAIIRGRRLFHIFLTGDRALNILFYYTIKSKN